MISTLQFYKHYIVLRLLCHAYTLDVWELSHQDSPHVAWTHEQSGKAKQDANIPLAGSQEAHSGRRQGAVQERDGCFSAAVRSGERLLPSLLPHPAGKASLLSHLLIIEKQLRGQLLTVSHSKASYFSREQATLRTRRPLRLLKYAHTQTKHVVA